VFFYKKVKNFKNVFKQSRKVSQSNLKTFFKTATPNTNKIFVALQRIAIARSLQVNNPKLEKTAIKL